MSRTSISLAKSFEGVEIRTTPEGHMVAIDVLAALGLKDAGRSWRKLKKRHPELQDESSPYRFGKGRPPETLGEQGVYKLAMVAGGPKAAAFRDWAANQLQRIRKADPTLTAELIERTEDPATLEWLAVRAKSKHSVLSLAATASQRGMKRRQDFAKLNDSNNVFVTASTAKELQAARGTNITRDSFSEIELATLDLLQVTQKQHIEITDARGPGQILDRQEDVRSVLRPFRDQFLGPKARPVDKNGQKPLITVEV